ncbi:hypothetical protein HHI36_012848 [Cryptolaemus montrouzieri]|uniref:Uncharacterized protein n=1 Tax=Cryptolaemus montrouzieri TaxID=559131 RepID=A0ABD2NGE9_9CUCU
MTLKSTNGVELTQKVTPQTSEAVTKNVKSRNTRKTAVTNTVIQGSGLSTMTFSGAARRAWLHISRANTNANEENVRNYLGNKFPDKEFMVEALPRRDDSNSVIQG